MDAPATAAQPTAPDGSGGLPAPDGPDGSGGLPAPDGSGGLPALGGSGGLPGPGRDVITLRGLTVRGHHGVYDFERARGQDFVVDVALELDTAPAAASDEIRDTVHYGELADRLAAIVSGDPVNLIETLADRLCAACLSDARVAAATVTVHKPGAPISHAFSDVSVTVRRENAGPGGRP